VSNSQNVGLGWVGMEWGGGGGGVQASSCDACCSISLMDGTRNVTVKFELL
jgi:hypothetical protein